MGLTDIEAFLRRLKRKPLRALILLAILVIVVASGAWVTSYFSEKGKLTAAAKPGDVKFRPIASDAKKAEVRRLASVPMSRASQAAVPSTAIAIEQVTIGLNANQSRVDFAVRNRSESSVVLRRITLSGTRNMGWSALCLRRLQQSIIVIALSDLVVAPTVDGARIAGRFEDSSASGFDYPVSGKYVTDECGSARLDLETEHTIELPQHSLTIFHLVVPKSARFERRVPKGKIVHKTYESIDIDLATLHTLTVRATESGGAVAELELERQAVDDGR